MRKQHPAIAYYGSLRALARALGRSPGTLIARRHKRQPMITAEEAVELERDSGGELRREAMRPDLWS